MQVKNSKKSLFSLEEECQYIKANGRKCHLPLCGQAWRYCPLHSESGPKQYKAMVQKRDRYVEVYRQSYQCDDEYRRRNRTHQFRFRHGLTTPKLILLLDHSEPIHEAYTCQDDFHEAAVATIDAIKGLIIHPPADLPSAAHAARKEVRKLRTSLEKHPWDPRHASTRTRLILSTKELQRDIGWWNRAKTLTKISAQAKAVQELMRQEKVLVGFIHALLVQVEIFRIKYFATTQQYYLDQARRWIAEVEYICDLALNRPTGGHKQLLAYFRFYIDAVKVRMAFDAGEGEQAAAHVHALDHRAMAFVDAYSTGQMVATVSFLTAMGQAEHQLQRRNIAGAYDHLREAEAIFATMQWRSIESHHYVACVKTDLALASNNLESPQYVQDYMSVFYRYPCFEYRHRLGARKRAYPKELAEVILPDDRALFLDATFTHIHPFVSYV